MDIFLAILSGLVSGLIPSLLLWIKNRRLKRLCVSSGLATGYYHNFIAKIFFPDTINFTLSNNTQLELKPHKNVFLEIIIPSELNQAVINNAVAYESKFDSGTLNLSNRQYPIHYEQKSGNLHIIDFPNPLEALNHYLINLNLNDEDLRRKRKEEEKENFQKSIKRLVKDPGFGRGQITYKNENGRILD